MGIPVGIISKAIEAMLHKKTVFLLRDSPKRAAAKRKPRMRKTVCLFGLYPASLGVASISARCHRNLSGATD